MMFFNPEIKSHFFIRIVNREKILSDKYYPGIFSYFEYL